VGYLRLLRAPVPRLLWGGQLGSAIGDKLYYLAAGWVTWRLTGSPVAVGAVAALSAIPLIAAGIAGASLMDRGDRFRRLIGLDLAQGAAVMIIPLLSAIDALAVWHLALVGMVLSGLSAVHRPALKATLPALVEREQLQPFVGLMDLTDRLSRIVGPGAAGLLLVVIPEVHLFTLDAASFVLSAVALAAIARRARLPTTQSAPREGMGHDILEGWSYVGRHPTLRVVIGLRIFANALWALLTIGMPIIVTARFHGDLGSYGAMVGAFGVGTLVSSLVVGNLRVGDRLLSLGFLAWVIVGVGFAAVAFAPSLPLAVVALTLVGLGTPLAIVPIDTFIGQRVPASMRTRAYAVQFVAVEGTAILALLPAGLVLERVSVDRALGTAGVALALVAAFAAVAFRDQRNGA